jgi:primary-amine oxidase
MTIHKLQPMVLAWRRSLCGIAIAITAATACAGEVTQHFPAHMPEAAKETAWRVQWDYTHPGQMQFNTVYISGASFMRGYKEDGSEDWVEVLKDARIAELHVPYDDYGTLWDISAGLTKLSPAKLSHTWPSCVAPSRLLDTYTMMEVHDNSLRWMDMQDRSRRGQIMTLWFILDAGNYRYLIEYGFRDDGVVTFRMGATGRNLYPKEADGGDNHLHTGCWRVEMALGDPANNEVYVSRRIAQPSGRTSHTMELVTQEGAFTWDPKQYTRLRIINRGAWNAHNPPNNIGYDLVPERTGSIETYRPDQLFLNNDFFVTAAIPRQPETPGEVPQLTYRKLGDTYLQTQEDVTSRATVLWHHSSLSHASRDEDFTANGYGVSGAVALTAWAGFHLKPRNLFSSTPLYPGPPGQTAAGPLFLQGDY